MSEAAVNSFTGAFVGGRYRLLEQIGRGSVGTVHRARDEFLGRDVAIKLIAPPVLDADDLRRDEDEVKVLARLNHHGLVTLFDAGSDTSDLQGPRLYLVMELVDGPDLRDRLAQGPLPPLDVAQIGYDMAEALGYVHDHGVIHRDVKPANIMMFDYHNDPARVRAKLTDFGIAVMMEAPLAGGAFVGTAAYVSPEQAKGEALGPPSDIYSLGLVLLECLTGVVSYPGEALPSALARLLQGPEIPADLDPLWVRLLTSMTATDPASRPTARETAISLGEITLEEKDRRAFVAGAQADIAAAREAKYVANSATAIKKSVLAAALMAAEAASHARDVKAGAAACAALDMADTAAQTATDIQTRADALAIRVATAASTAADIVSASIASGGEVEGALIALQLAATVDAAAIAIAEETALVAAAVATAVASAATQAALAAAAAAAAFEREVTNAAAAVKRVATTTAHDLALNADAKAVEVAQAAIGPSRL